MRFAWIGLIALALPALSSCSEGAAAAGPPAIEVAIHHSAFRPARIEVERGSTVTFVVRNHDPIAHELIVGDAAVQRRHENGTEKEHGAVPGEISIPAGSTRSTTYTFSGAAPLIFGCHLPGHYDYGMRGTILVDS